MVEGILAPGPGVDPVKAPGIVLVWAGLVALSSALVWCTHW